MKLKAIKSDIEYQECLNWLDLKLDKNHPFDSPDGVNIQRVLLLIRQYEDTNYPIPKPEIGKNKKVDFRILTQSVNT